MIRPTVRAAILAWLGAPVALGLALVAPAAWSASLLWIAVVGALTLADALLAAPRRALAVTHAGDGVLYAGTEGALDVTATFDTETPPRTLDLILETNDLLRPEPPRLTAGVVDRAARARFALKPKRRGEARLERLWARWRGPLGLVALHRALPIEKTIPVTPDIQSVTKEAIRIFSRYSAFGQKPQLLRGDGSEFDALKEFVAGMDKRAIDWKQSARHRALLAKEFAVEHNHTIMFAVDTGRLMCEPIGDAARVDHALNAALLLAFVSLKLGDRVGFFAFDARPRLATGAVAGTTSFPLLQRLTAGVDYSAEETNYTLGLTSLAAELQRRSLVVIFTEFADTTNAELMLENVERLMRRHLVLFVAFRDAELEDLVRTEPQEADDVTRAVLAASLLEERRKVIARLQRMGAEVVDAPAERVGVELINRYFAVTRQERL